jgi:hypothetical protein
VFSILASICQFFCFNKGDLSRRSIAKTEASNSKLQADGKPRPERSRMGRLQVRLGVLNSGQLLLLLKQKTLCLPQHQIGSCRNLVWGVSVVKKAV